MIRGSVPHPGEGDGGDVHGRRRAFDNLKQAVEFVAERGGGVVYTELAGTKFAENLKLPDNVQLKPRRLEEEQAA
jgi:hypothetical protein